ncbi:hypothetical protein HmCmsJML181_03209 [Escherichia coli]|nr:hypothetical protein HmCmsJML181_03209 [Escherichia coli]
MLRIFVKANISRFIKKSESAMVISDFICKHCSDTVSLSLHAYIITMICIKYISNKENHSKNH